MKSLYRIRCGRCKAEFAQGSPCSCPKCGGSIEIGVEGVKTWKNPNTIATGISDGYPIDAEGAYKAIRDTNGLVEIVSDDEIIEAQILLAKKEGIFAEPTGVVSLAGLIKLFRNGQIDATDVVACEITGHGSNDIEPTVARIDDVPEIQPVLEDFEGVLTSLQSRG
jgi:threonine synthase